MHKLQDYQIRFAPSDNFPGKLVAYIVEIHSVVAVVDSEEDAHQALSELFEREVQRLQSESKSIPPPGQAADPIVLASSEKIDNLRPFIDSFWLSILGTPFQSSFVSDESHFESWEHTLSGGKQELIERVKAVYGVDITNLYDQPIWKILGRIKTGKQ